ncbi:hypothetical protein [Limnoglobus roseus]|uniref:Uncharacterized protein n=1 Tax=Limnoglobus roseus TaxID=2598579 RepID=A0A5C1AIN2_9BACT|nr:hypothetical protein [Limnoglobus roseus]QEL18103.1 hypothetical protein PX52LOC_05117 [Limnoglobus roseus]
MTPNIVLPTRRLDPAFVDLLKGLTPGERIKITQTVRVGGRTWPAEAAGVFRGLSYLSTGVTVDRVPEDDVIVPTVHFTKDSGELASISIDENTKVVKI